MNEPRRKHGSNARSHKIWQSDFIHLYDLKAGVFNPPPNKKGAVPKVMSVALIEPFNRWFLSLSKGSGTTRRNDCYTKCGGFDKLNHRNANLLDSLFYF